MHFVTTLGSINVETDYRVVTHLESKRVIPENFTSRTTGVLNKIAKEHWRRQMKQEEEEEELVGDAMWFTPLCYLICDHI